MSQKRTGSNFNPNSSPQPAKPTGNSIDLTNRYGQQQHARIRSDQNPQKSDPKFQSNSTQSKKMMSQFKVTVNQQPEQASKPQGADQYYNNSHQSWKTISQSNKRMQPQAPYDADKPTQQQPAQYANFMISNNQGSNNTVGAQKSSGANWGSIQNQGGGGPGHQRVASTTYQGGPSVFQNVYSNTNQTSQGNGRGSSKNLQKNSISQGLVINRKKRLINTLSSQVAKTGGQSAPQNSRVSNSTGPQNLISNGTNGGQNGQTYSQIVMYPSAPSSPRMINSGSRKGSQNAQKGRYQGGVKVNSSQNGAQMGIQPLTMNHPRNKLNQLNNGGQQANSNIQGIQGIYGLNQQHPDGTGNLSQRANDQKVNLSSLNNHQRHLSVSIERMKNQAGQATQPSTAGNQLSQSNPNLNSSLHSGGLRGIVASQTASNSPSNNTYQVQFGLGQRPLGKQGSLNQNQSHNSISFKQGEGKDQKSIQNMNKSLAASHGVIHPASTTPGGYTTLGPLKQTSLKSQLTLSQGQQQLSKDFMNRPSTSSGQGANSMAQLPGQNNLLGNRALNNRVESQYDPKNNTFKVNQSYNFPPGEEHKEGHRRGISEKAGSRPSIQQQMNKNRQVTSAKSAKNSHEQLDHKGPPNTKLQAFNMTQSQPGGQTVEASQKSVSLNQSLQGGIVMPQLTRKLGGQPSQNKHRKLVSIPTDGKREEGKSHTTLTSTVEDPEGKGVSQSQQMAHNASIKPKLSANPNGNSVQQLTTGGNKTQAFASSQQNSPTQKTTNAGQQQDDGQLGQLIIKKKVAKSQNYTGRVSPLQNTAKQPSGHHADPPKAKKTNKEGKNCVRKFAFATRVGYHPNNPNKVNQDQYILAPNIKGLPALHLFGICDGHGQFGREVSNFVKVSMAPQIEKRYGQDLSAEEEKVFDFEHPEDASNPHKPLIKQLQECFIQINKEVEENVPNCLFSGTTCSIVLTRGPQIISANSGDSRAIIVDKDGCTKQLSRDHKPDCPDEKKRILGCGGRVRPLLNQQMGGIEVGPARVWLQENEVPGLAMSRSLGDYVAQSVGVSPIPEINIYDISPDDRVIIIASDGVWEFLSNEAVAEMAMRFYDTGQAEQAANTIVREAADQWKSKEDVIDDITCVVVFMDVKLIERSLKYREIDVKQLEKLGLESDQASSIISVPLNKYFKNFRDGPDKE